MALFGKKKQIESGPARSDPQQAAEEQPSPPGGLLSKFRQGLNKTAQLLKTDVRDLFKAEGRLVDEQYLDELLGINIKTDMGYQAASEIVERVQSDYRGRVITTDEIVATWKTKLQELMAQENEPMSMAEHGTTVILMCGVNGSGKTTSIAKLAHLFVSQGNSVLLGAADTFRAAAVEQLEIWSNRIGARMVKGEPGSNPASVAYRAVETARDEGVDICLVDTAGRLQTQKNLMAELTKIQSTVRKLIPEAPHEVLLVLDATTGQNGISQANRFVEAAGCTGIVLAKLDGTAKGGVVVAIRQQIGLPVKFVGVGERPEDLARFDPRQFVDALFDDLGVAVSS